MIQNGLAEDPHSSIQAAQRVGPASDLPVRVQYRGLLFHSRAVNAKLGSPLFRPADDFTRVWP